MKPSFKLIDMRNHKFGIFGNCPPEKSDFRIESMENTTQFVAGTYLSENDVNDLISHDFKVHIRQPLDRDFRY